MSAKSTTVEFDGVWKSWRSWKTFINAKTEDWEQLRDTKFFSVDDFQAYVRDGEIPPVAGVKHIRSMPPWVRCDSALGRRSFYWRTAAYLTTDDIERVRCFRLSAQASRHTLLVDNFRLRQLKLRNPERYGYGVLGANLSMRSVFDYALAVVHDSGNHVKQMLEMHIKNQSNDEIYDDEHYPLAHAVLRVLCDAYAVPTIRFRSIAYSVPALEELVANWRTENVEQYQRMMHKLCDIHTWQCRASKYSSANAVVREFANGEYDNYPVEVLMIMRLRQNLGLPNPEIDHPLMQRPLSYLPEVSNEEVHDELLDAVLARMKTQGYDEEQIYLWTVKPETCTLEALQAVEAKAEAATPQT